MRTEYKISEEAAAKVREYRKKVRDKYLDRRLHVIQLLSEGMKAREIAEKLDVDKRQISEWAKNFCKRGLEGFTAQRGGRHRENMSFEDEAKLLEAFKERAESGQIVEVSEIRAAYEKAIGRKTHPTQIYQVLHRHDWRKVMPRSRHPKKASNEAIKASKKLNPK